MTKRIVILIGLVLLCLIGLLIYGRLKNGRDTLPPQYRLNSLTGGTSAWPSSVPSVAHVVIILEENKPEEDVIGSPAAPFTNHLASAYSRGRNYYAVTNPSLPNYLAITSGSNDGIKNDCNPPSGSCQANERNIADRLEAAGKTWKEYAESMPGACYANNAGAYAVRHNPFLYYPDILAIPSRCYAHDVPFSNLSSDLLQTSSLPDYSFITPNLCNDMHNCSVATGDRWLSQYVPQILQSPAFTTQNSLLVIVWDEGDASNNNVPVIFAGPAAKAGYVSAAYYSHYSLLHTIEAVWNLVPLTTNDAHAPLMLDMLRSQH